MTLRLDFVRKMSQAESLCIKYMEKKQVFLVEDIKVKDPICIFREWLDDALKSEETQKPKVGCLATASSDGRPSNRFVVVKDVTDKGFTFFANYGSRKAQEIACNPNVALSFYWCPLRRSVRIEGIAEKIPQAESEAFFKARPRAIQIGDFVSDQISCIASRQHLDLIESEIKAKLGDAKDVPMPNWGGYLIRPRQMEFWQGHADRLHDRIRFRKAEDLQEHADGKLTHKGDNGWVYERLAP